MKIKRKQRRIRNQILLRRINIKQNLFSFFYFLRLGVNLRTGRQGIFPSAYAVDMDYSDFDPTAPKVKRERYLLGYLGSVETLAHKGTGVVCQAVRRILRNSSQDPPISQSCILEVSDQGLRMVDRSKPRVSVSLRSIEIHSCVQYMSYIFLLILNKSVENKNFKFYLEKICHR